MNATNLKEICEKWYAHSKTCIRCTATIERLGGVEWVTVAVKRGKLLLCDEGRAILREIFT